MKNHWVIFFLAIVTPTISSAQINDASNTVQGIQSDSSVDKKILAKIKELRETLVTNPKDGQTRLMLTQLLFNAKMYKDAVIEGNIALTFFNDHPSLHYMVGESYRQLNQPQNALKILEKGYNLIGGQISEGLVTSYGMTLLRLNKLAEAAKVFRKIAKGNSNYVEKRLQAGSSAYKIGQMQAATEEWLAVSAIDSKKLTQEQKDFVDFNYNFRTYVESNNITDATSAFISNLNKKFDDKLIYDDMGKIFQCLVSQKQIDKARGLFISLIQIPAETMTQDSLDVAFFHNAYALGFQCTDLRAVTKNVFKRVAKRHLELDDQELTPLYKLYDFTIQQGATSIAEDITSQIMVPASSVKRYTHLANLFIKFNKSEDAVTTFKIMLKKGKLDDLGYSDDLTQLYGSLITSKKIQDAQSFMNQLEFLNVAELIPTYNSLAEVFTRANQGEKAITILNKLLSIDPGNVKASIQLGEAYYVAGRFDDMISSFLSVKAKDGRRFLAMAYEKKYMLTEANQAWQEFIALTGVAEDINGAKDRIRQNTIAMMNPDFQNLKLTANKKPEVFHLVIDSPRSGEQISTASTTVQGHVVGAVTIQDFKINGRLIEGLRGMKVLQEISPTNSISPQSKFNYPVSLSQGKNKIFLEAVSTNGDTAVASVTVNYQSVSIEKTSMLSLEQADSIRQNKAYAVLVGIANYESKDIRSLTYTTNDAKELAEVLIDPKYGGFKPENVTLLLDKTATTKNIKKSLGTGLRKVPSDGIALVFFAGHGAPEGNNTYWLTYDTDPNDLYASALSNNEIAEMLEQVNTKCVVTFIDACYSGASIKTSKSSRAFVEDPFKSFEGTGQIAITSSDGKQQSLEDNKLKHGIFSYRLIEALKGKADENTDGIVTADEVAGYIKRTVPNDARERSWKQDPVVKAEYTGIIPISMNPENAVKRSKTKKIALFEGLYDQEKITANELRRIKNIIAVDDQRGNKKIIDYLNGDLDLETLLRFVNE